MRLTQLTAALLVLFGLTCPAQAETNEVRIAQPYGLGYLPSYVTVDRHLIEKYATAAGLGDIKVTLTQLSSGPAGADMMLSGNADIAMGGFGPAFTLWDKTKGSLKVRGIMPLTASPVFLISVDPRIKTLVDFGENDRIAVSAVKVTDQAITLQMAAAKEFGWDQRFKLDPLTVSMSNPDGLAAMLSGRSEVKNHATILPFSVMEMESGKAHMVMTSDDVLGHGNSAVVMWTLARFHDPNPKVYAAVVAAFEEAIDWINQHPHEAAELYVKREPQPKGVEWVEKMLLDKNLIEYSSTPRGTLAHAQFMYKVGTLHNEAKSWQDLFWENEASKDGS
jgi:NitT/TauT family transport system substrate-binding protein